MTLELFISILVISATATSIAVEIIKTLLNKAGIKYKSVPVAVITSFVIGIAEIIIYYITHNMNVNIITVLYSICMGAANSISATCGYDLTKKFIYALMGKTET